MTDKIFVGIDPGALGAICALRINSDGSHNIVFMDNKINPMAKHVLLQTLNKEGIQMCMIEDVASIPGASAKANFTFGWNVGELRTLLDIQNFGYDLVKPKVWQKIVGVSVPTKFKGTDRKKRIKNQVADICERVYPGCSIRGPKGGLLDGRSDSLMIAHYSRLKYKL